MKKRNIFRLGKLGLFGSLGLAASMTFAAAPSVTENNSNQKNTTTANHKLSTAKTTAIQAIENIKSSTKLVKGATAPTAEQTAFDKAVADAKAAIENATSIASVKELQAKWITTVTEKGVALDQAITAANAKKTAADLTKKANENQIDNFNNITNWAKSRMNTNVGKNTLPSDIAKKIKDKLSFEEYVGLKLPQLKGNATIKIKASNDDENGLINFSIVVKTPKAVNPESKDVSAIVYGFQTLKQRQDSNKIQLGGLKKYIEKLNNHVAKKIEKKLPSEVSSSIKDLTTFKKITGDDSRKLILKPNEKIMILSAFPNDENGKINVSFQASIADVIKPIKETIMKSVGGFSNKAERDELIKKSNADILSVISSIANLNNTKPTLFNGNSIFASSLKSKSLSQDFGFRILDLKGTNVKYTFVKADDRKGELTIKANVKKQFGLPKNKEFVLKGFKKYKSSSRISRWAIMGISIEYASVLGMAIFLFGLLRKRRKK